MNLNLISHKKLLPLWLILLCILQTIACSPATQPITYTDYYFNTVVNLTFYNSRDAILAEECFEICAEYENLLSRTIEGSDVWNINHSNGEPVTVSDETYELIEEALYYCALTDGRIDITVAPLMDLWNFTEGSDNQSPPTEEEIYALLAHVDYTQIKLQDNCTITLKDPEAAIDLGFIAKGYIADKIKEYLLSQGVTSAIINLGGNVTAIGNKPDGSGYTVGVQKPFAPVGNTMETLEITDSSVVTSGTYERYFEHNGIIYHHILDATTGYPIQNGLTGVTILCPSSTQADALSTTCFVLGKEEALEYIESLENTNCILIDENEILYKTQH